MYEYVAIPIGPCDVRGAVMAGVVAVFAMPCDDDTVVASEAEGGVDVEGGFSPSGSCVRWCWFRLTTSPTRATNWSRDNWATDNWATEETGGRVIAPSMVFVGSLVAVDPLPDLGG